MGSKTSFIVTALAVALTLVGSALVVYGQISDYKAFGIGLTLLAASVPVAILSLRK